MKSPLLLALPLVLLPALSFAADTAPNTAPVAAEAKVAPAAPEPAPAADAATPAAGDAGAAPVHAAAEMPTAQHWTFVPTESSLTFHGSQMGTAFDGSFAHFTPDIYFDAEHLDQSKVTADIDLASVDAKDSDRNKNITGADWFDVQKFPTARFETTKITKTGDNAYLADATLTIHGVTQSLQLPFTLQTSKVAHGKDSGKEKAVMTGKVTLDRSKFQLGQGDWADPSVIANDVPVEVKVTAIADSAAKPEENKNTHQAAPTNP